MNDDFLKKHYVRLDAEFVEKLYLDLEKTESSRSSQIFSLNRFNLWLRLASGVALLLIGFLAFTIFTNMDALSVLQVRPIPEIVEIDSVSNSDVEPSAVDVETDEALESDTAAEINHELTSYRINGLVNEPQKFNNQGPATLSILLNYYGNDTTQDKVANVLKPNHNDRNVSPWQISDYVNNLTGLRSLTRSNGSQELIRKLIVNDFPVVIEKGYDAEISDAFGWYGHYLILFGFDNTAQEYNTIDTFLGPFTEADVRQPEHVLADGLIYSYEHVSRYWQQFNYTFYVVYEAGREQELYSILGDEFIDTEASWQAAAERTEAETLADATNPFAWFNLGTSLTELGKQKKGQTTYYEQAAQAFDKAFAIGLPPRMLWYQHGPFVAYLETGRYQDVLDLAEATFEDAGGREIEEVWLHKGHAQVHLEDFEGALASYTKALDLNENFYPAQFAKDYVESLPKDD